MILAEAREDIPLRPPAHAALPCPADLDDGGRRAFLRTVSHELRTPLNAIIGFSDILSCELYGPLGSDQYREYATIIRESGHKLLRLVNDILELARLEGGSADLALTEESLRQAVEAAAHAVRMEAAAGDVILSIDADSLTNVLADPRALRTIVFNLLHRAVIKTRPHGEVRVRAEASGGLVRLEILDGSGEDGAEDLAALQVPLHEGAEDGADLGLPIVRLLVEALGGRLKMDAEAGHGLRATVSFRAPQGEARLIA